MKRNILLVFALLSILLVGCGTIANAASGQTNTATLPDTLEVVSLSGPTTLHKTITDQASVQSLYEKLYALPRIHPSPLLTHGGPGPVSFGYQLQFFAQHRLLKQVVLQTISFHGLTLAPNDYRQVTDQFWSTFAQTIHEPLAGQANALGQIAGGPAVGALGNISLRAALVVAGAALSPALLLFVRARRQGTEVPTPEETTPGDAVPLGKASTLDEGEAQIDVI